MQVVFRADASVELGSGHVMRCLALACHVSANGGAVRFICREEAGNLAENIKAEGFAVDFLPVDAPFSAESDVLACLELFQKQWLRPDWVVIDHYGIDEVWESKMRRNVGHILVIDDLADRCHDCDMLLDQNFHDSNPYQPLVSPDTIMLLGPTYALLREEFRRAREELVERHGTVQRIVLFFGGGDPSGETLKVVAALKQLHLANIEVDVIVGAANPRKSQIAQLCADLANVNFYCQITDMASFLLRADLALGAAGVSSWERLALALPALVVAVAENQRENMHQLHRLGVAVGLGLASEMTEASWVEAIDSILADTEALSVMSKNAFGLVDGLGAKRVVDLMAARLA